jgi:small subunit ribosomal protein S3
MAIERKFVAQNLKEFQIKEFVSSQISRVGLSGIKLQRTPLGDKILIRASRPGLVVGRAGSNIQKLTEALKNEFNLENPQIEIEEVETIGLDANIIAEMIVNSMERFGSQRFKGVGHRAISDVMNAGALGVEILISGKVPSQRAKTWRFYQGYLKKCGDVAISGVDVAYKTAVLKSGAVGVKVSIMPPTTKLPDQIILQEPDPETVEEVTEPEVKAEMEKKVDEAKPEEKAEKAPKAESKAEPTSESKKEKPAPKPAVKSEKKTTVESPAEPVAEPKTEEKAEKTEETEEKAEAAPKKE